VLAGAFGATVAAGAVLCGATVCAGAVVGIVVVSAAGEDVVVGVASSMLDVVWVVAKESDPVLDSESCEDPQPTKASVAKTNVVAICFLIDITVPQMRVKARKIYCGRGFLPSQACFCYLNSNVSQLGRPDRSRDLTVRMEHSHSYHEPVVL
jgi:hypothetical protein